MTNINKLSQRLGVYQRDQWTDVVNFVFYEQLAETTTTGIERGSYSFIVADATGFSAGNVVSILLGKSKLYQTFITGVDGATITTATPSPYDVEADSRVRTGEQNMNVDGSVTPQVFRIKPPEGVAWDIYSISVAITDKTAMDDSKFGGLSALSKGVYLYRYSESEDMPIGVATTNGQARLLAGPNNFAYADKAAAGYYGLTAKFDFASKTGDGVSVRVDGSMGEELRLVVQDDLTGLDSFNIVCAGHVVDDDGDLSNP